MFFSKAQVEIIGNVGKEPELFSTSKGTPICKVSVAVNVRHKEGEKFSNETHWFEITFWNKQAELAATHLHKGDKVFIIGELRTYKFETKDGRTIRGINIVANDFMPIGSAQSQDTSKIVNMHKQIKENSGDDWLNNYDFEDEEDDIPF